MTHTYPAIRIPVHEAVSEQRITGTYHSAAVTRDVAADQAGLNCSPEDTASSPLGGVSGNGAVSNCPPTSSADAATAGIFPAAANRIALNKTVQNQTVPLTKDPTALDGKRIGHLIIGDPAVEQKTRGTIHSTAAYKYGETRGSDHVADDVARPHTPGIEIDAPPVFVNGHSVSDRKPLNQSHGMVHVKTPCRAVSVHGGEC